MEDTRNSGELVTLMGYPVGHVWGRAEWNLEQVEVLVKALRKEAEHAAEVPFRSMQADLENLRQQRDLLEQELEQAQGEAQHWYRLWQRAAMAVLAAQDGAVVTHMGAGTGPGHTCGPWCVDEGGSDEG